MLMSCRCGDSRSVNAASLADPHPRQAAGASFAVLGKLPFVGISDYTLNAMLGVGDRPEVFEHPPWRKVLWSSVAE
jgi:hypothetical protein